MRLALALSMLVLACGDDSAVPPDAAPDVFDAGPVGRCTTLVPGLYAGDCTTIAAGVRPYRPAYELWTDAADKERFIVLPPGTAIDANDPDAWVFPLGTVLYKTFSIGGLKLETRVMEKFAAAPGFESWNFRVFLWSADQLSVTETSGEPVPDVLGTEHDVPSHMQCVMCHSVTADGVNGLATVQMAADDIDALVTDGLLAPAPTHAGVPGDDTARAALGYLHANCAHCHRPGADDSELHLQLSVDDLTVEDTAAFMTAVGVSGTWIDAGATIRIVAGDPDSSTVLRRMESRDLVSQMPPIGTEQVDPAGVSAVRAWVDAL